MSPRFAKAILPSGDHDGVAPAARTTRAEPSAFATKMLGLPPAPPQPPRMLHPQNLVPAILVPSGDHAGSAKPGVRPSVEWGYRSCRVPSAFITTIQGDRPTHDTVG